ncbi:hypothetical protein [Anatilimnocola floriformis]|uniref:hypothetical protein n=1 Tax=Anatilimnocola floriformis TaxID=2948575 RepID=UPI0020C1DD07|nr:hypothetical protein [Anatilimnocola floriformis]
MKTRLTAATLGLALLAMLTACGPSGPPVIPVQGKVTFGGVPWPKPATLDFTPTKPAPGMPGKTITTVAAADGSYLVQLPPGEYVISITCNEIEPSPDNPSTRKSYLPDRFAIGENRQKVTVPVDTKGTIDLTWDVPKE